MPSDAAIILVSESDNAYYAHSANGAGIRGTVWVAGFAGIILAPTPVIPL